MNKQREMSYKTEIIKKYKVTAQDIRKYLGEPDEYRENYYCRSAPASELYYSDRVAKVFDSPKIIECIKKDKELRHKERIIQGNLKRQETRKKNEEKNKKIREERKEVRNIEIERSILSKALYLINKQAKNSLLKEKEELYNLKDQVIRQALDRGDAEYLGYHKKEHVRVKYMYDYDYEEIERYDVYFKLYKIGELTFHQLVMSTAINYGDNYLGYLQKDISAEINKNIVGDLTISKATMILKRYLSIAKAA